MKSLLRRAKRINYALKSFSNMFETPYNVAAWKVVTTATEGYLQCLGQWKEGIVQHVKRASKSPANTVAPRNARTFNHEYVPLLKHFFEDNSFLTHVNKMFLTKKSNIEYRQIHVWFQNRRDRTEKEGKTLRKEPTYEGITKPLDKPYERTKGSWLMLISASQNEDAYTLPLSTSIDDLVERFSHLNVRDDTRSNGSSKLHAVTAAITVIPSRAPHPSLIVRKYRQARIIVQRHPSDRAPVSRFNVFQSPVPTSKPVTLVPPSAPPNKSELSGKRKTAPLPRRFPGRTRNTRRDTTPSECSSTSCSSPRLFSADSESRSCSSSVSSLSTPSDVASIQELPHSFESPCRSPFDSPIHLRGLGNMVAISSTIS